jgi:hypothetical protein
LDMPMTRATRLSASAGSVETQNKNPNKKRNADLTPGPQKFVTVFHINRGLNRQAIGPPSAARYVRWRKKEEGLLRPAAASGHHA